MTYHLLAIIILILIIPLILAITAYSENENDWYAFWVGFKFGLLLDFAITLTILGLYLI